jgi:hypothetical protein
MSYDFFLFKQASGEQDLVTVARQKLQGHSQGPNPGVAKQEAEVEKRLLADSLLEHNPALEEGSFDFSELAAFMNQGRFLFETSPGGRSSLHARDFEVLLKDQLRGRSNIDTFDRSTML